MLVESILLQNSIHLLEQLISIPSFSKKEEKTATCIQLFFEEQGIPTFRKNNNVWVVSRPLDKELPVILLNSHHDTVRPGHGWIRDPFVSAIEGGKLFGLGSNDAGASLVSLATVFVYFYSEWNLPFNLIFLASAEEEISGSDGVESVLPELGLIDFAIVGEPTQMKMAIAEKGLMVIDAISKGIAGHAARNEGQNAIYKALLDIQKLINYRFDRISDTLGEVNISVTQVSAGTQHNVIPDECRFVIDVRTTNCYSNQEVFTVLQQLTDAELKARSFRLGSSGISLEHPVVQAGLSMDLKIMGSETLSDQALMPFDSIKIGPGDSLRSHTADEFVLIEEIEEAIHVYIQIIKKLIPHYKN